MSQKIYLEPRKKFDACISEETYDYTKYSVQKILNLLTAEFASEDFLKSPTESHRWMAQEWFDYKIEPLANYYNLSFTFEQEPYERS